jgi:two-component system NtrC family sensor kinase
MTFIAIVSHYQQITVFLFCAVVAVLVVFQLSEAITDHLREAGLKREQFLARAEQPNKLASIGRLAAGVAHEINNPLAIINQQAGLIQDIQEMSPDFPHKDMVAESLAGIQKSVKRCKVITHRLLGFAHQTGVKIEEVDINTLLHEAVDFLAEEASYNRIGINFVLDKKIQHPWTDRGELLQIFLNIIGNAIDALAESGGTVTLSSKQVDSKTLRICIADNGPGMTTEVQRHIFDPFFTTKETGRGTGLGLSIVYGLIRKLGGTVNVVSEVGKGTEFEIELPVHQEEE